MITVLAWPSPASVVICSSLLSLSLSLFPLTRSHTPTHTHILNLPRSSHCHAALRNITAVTIFGVFFQRSDILTLVFLLTKFAHRCHWTTSIFHFRAALLSRREIIRSFSLCLGLMPFNHGGQPDRHRTVACNLYGGMVYVHYICKCMFEYI